MDLRSFITTSISDIYHGVKDAQKILPEGAVIPYDDDTYKTMEVGMNSTQAVKFEVAVRVDEQKGKAAKLSVVAGVFGGALSDNSTKGSGHSGTLQFSVPIRFTTINDDEDEENEEA
jgi:hypothetical protein